MLIGRMDRCGWGLEGRTEDDLVTVNAEDLRALGAILRVRNVIEGSVKVALCSEPGAREPSYRLVNGKNPNEFRLQRPPTWRVDVDSHQVKVYVDGFLNLLKQVK